MAPDGTDEASLAEQLERLATRVAVAAGRLVVDERPSHLSPSATKSSPTDVVTVMDTRSEELIRSLILAERPDDGVLGEEGADHVGRSGITWVVDPIDGTVNYLYDIPAYAVSVAAATGDPRVPGAWQVVAGAVADPPQRQVFHARRGGGAWLERWPTTSGADEGTVTRLIVGDAASLAVALVGTGFGYTPKRRLSQATLLLDVLPRVRDIRRMGSAALDLCAVARGSLDGFYEVGLNAWDLAAGWLIVEEAGGQMTGPAGGAPSGVLAVAGNAAVVSELLEIVDR
ncbi:MAG: inositol monophosphatase [Actinomycetota bacterium]|nr:inositol monophosphatase [Actinomycetota bacterium]